MFQWFLALMLFTNTASSAAGLIEAPPEQQISQANQELVSCDEWFVSLVEKTGVDELDLLPFVGCRKLENKVGWFQGTIGADDQYVVDKSSYDAELLHEGVVIIETALREMLIHPYLTEQFEYDIDTYELTFGAKFYTPNEARETISLVGERFVRTDRITNVVYEAYIEGLYSYLTDPDNALIAEYFGWFVRTRDSTVEGALSLAGLNPQADQAIRNRAAVGLAPWPWHLADRSMIELYVAWVITTFVDQ